MLTAEQNRKLVEVMSHPYIPDEFNCVMYVCRVSEILGVPFPSMDEMLMDLSKQELLDAYEDLNSVVPQEDWIRKSGEAYFGFRKLSDRESPRVGDIIAFKGDSPRGVVRHIGIIIDEDGTYTHMNRRGAKIAKFHSRFMENRILGFWRREEK